MQSVEPYRDLNYALRKLRVQIMDGLPYALEECPKFSSPEKIFKWLQQRTVYKKDPKGKESFQTLETLLEPNLNIHGVGGAGDCDCFTIALLTLLTANGFYNLNGSDCGIVLVGRNRFVPVHIYAYANYDGNKEYLDLTNQWYNYQRDGYNFKQEIPLIINPKEEKEMILELAENFLSGKKSQQKPKKAARKEYKAEKKQLKRSAKLQKFLPPDVSSPEISPEVTDNYTFLPESDMHIRNDYFDNLDSAEFQNTMLEEGVSPSRIFELSAGRAQRKQAKQSGKAKTKQIKAKGKAARKQTKEELKNRMSGAEKAGIFSKVLDIGGGVVSKYTGAKIPEGGEVIPTGKTEVTPTETKKINILGMELTPLQATLGTLVAAGVTVAIVKAVKK